MRWRHHMSFPRIHGDFVTVKTLLNVAVVCKQEKYQKGLRISELLVTWIIFFTEQVEDSIYKLDLLLFGRSWMWYACENRRFYCHTVKVVERSSRLVVVGWEKWEEGTCIQQQKLCNELLWRSKRWINTTLPG